MSVPRTTLNPDKHSLFEAYQRILDHDPTKWDLYPHIAALLPSGTEQSHIYLQGAWRALERGAYEAAQNLSSAAERVYGRTFSARLIDIELLKRQGQGSAIPQKLLEIAETFNRKNLPTEEVKAYKRLSLLEPNPAYYQRIMILYTQINKIQKASEWASKLAKVAPPKAPPSVPKLSPLAPLPPIPIHKESTEAKQSNPIDKQISVSKPVKLSDIAFGKALWAKYFGDIGVEPPLPPDIDKILNSPCPIWPDKKISETHMLVLIPQTVNKKPLTLKVLGQLVQNPRQGKATKYSGFYVGSYTDFPTPKSYWVLMTRCVLPESRGKSYTSQEAIVAQYRQKTQSSYEIPTTLDAAVCLFMEYFLTGTCHYNDDPWTYTRCQETSSDDCHLVVGGFKPEGLNVSVFQFDSQMNGVGCLQKFEEKQEITIQSIPNEVSLKSDKYRQPILLSSTAITAVSKPIPREAIKITQPIIPALQASNLPDIAFGKALWKKYFGDVGVEPPLPLDIDQILNSSCPILPDKKVRETHLLVLVPQTVNGKPLTLKTLGELIQKPLQGNATKYRYFDIGEYKDPPAPQSHWALMSRNVIPGSRGKSYQEQHAQLVGLREKTKLPYEVPTLLDATVCICMEYFKTGTRLYSDNPYTYTRCQEKYNWTWNLVVGGFAPGGPGVNDSRYDRFSSGVAGLRKFF